MYFVAFLMRYCLSNAGVTSAGRCMANLATTNEVYPAAATATEAAVSVTANTRN